MSIKTMQIELINDQLAYIQPKYQISTRKNDNLEVDFDNVDEKYLLNDPPKYEEADLEKIPDEEFKDEKKYLFPLIPDDQFVDKMSIVEANYGKEFKEVYTSFFEKEEKKPIEKLKDSIKKLIEDALHKEQREERLQKEQNNLVLRDSYYRKNDFQSVFVKMIRMKKKMDEKKDSQTNEENDDYIEEEEDEEDELNLIKIKSGEYQVKEKSVPLRAMAVEKDDKKEKDKGPQDSIRASQERKNHKVVEIKHTSKEDEKRTKR